MLKVISDELAQSAGTQPTALVPCRRVLIAPVGRSPGVIATAWTRLRPRPDRWILVTSADCLPHAEVVLRRLGVLPSARHAPSHRCREANRRPVLSWVTSRPFACFDEAHAARRALGCWIDDALEVVVCLTGGSTALAFLAQEIAQEHRSVRRIALVEPQATCKRAAGSVLWLDGRSVARRSRAMPLSAI